MGTPATRLPSCAPQSLGQGRPRSAGTAHPDSAEPPPVAVTVAAPSCNTGVGVPAAPWQRGRPQTPVGAAMVRKGPDEPVGDPWRGGVRAGHQAYLGAWLVLLGQGSAARAKGPSPAAAPWTPVGRPQPPTPCRGPSSCPMLPPRHPLPLPIPWGHTSLRAPHPPCPPPRTPRSARPGPVMAAPHPALPAHHPPPLLRGPGEGGGGWQGPGTLGCCTPQLPAAPSHLPEISLAKALSRGEARPGELWGEQVRLRSCTMGQPHSPKTGGSPRSQLTGGSSEGVLPGEPGAEPRASPEGGSHCVVPVGMCQ